MTESAPTNTELNAATNVLKPMADKTRLLTLSFLCDGEMSVAIIASALDRPIPAISQHLAKLRMTNMVQTRKEGTSSFYSQPDEHLTNPVVNALHSTKHTLYSNPPHHHTQQAYTDALALRRKPCALLNLVGEPGA